MSSSPDDLRNQMARIRAGARWKAIQLKRETRQFSDWKYYVRSYPWLVVGGALALGYFLVPGRRPKPLLPTRKEQASEETVERVKKTGMLAAAAGLIWSVVYKAGLSYATRQLTQTLANRVSTPSQFPQEAPHEFRRTTFP